MSLLYHNGFSPSDEENNYWLCVIFYAFIENILLCFQIVNVTIWSTNTSLACHFKQYILGAWNLSAYSYFQLFIDIHTSIFFLKPLLFYSCTDSLE